MMDLPRIDLLRSAGRLADAERTIREGLAAEPQDAQLLWRLASVLQLDRPVEGLAAAAAAVAADPADPDAHLVLALLLVQNDRAHEAVDAAHTAMAMVPDHATAVTTYAYTLQRAGRLDQAAVAARRAVALAPHAPEAHSRLGEIALDARDLATARLAYEEVLRLDPTHAGARHNLAALDAGAHHPGRALAGLVAAGRMNPNPTTLAAVAAVLQQVGLRLRIGLVLAVAPVVVTPVVVGRAMADPSWQTRIAAAIVIVAAGFVVRLGTRDLPSGTGTVVRAALRADRSQAVAWVVVALALVVYGAVLVTGVAIVAVVVWPLMILPVALSAAAWIRRAARPR